MPKASTKMTLTFWLNPDGQATDFALVSDGEPDRDDLLNLADVLAAFASYYREFAPDEGTRDLAPHDPPHQPDRAPA